VKLPTIIISSKYYDKCYHSSICLQQSSKSK